MFTDILQVDILAGGTHFGQAGIWDSRIPSEPAIITGTCTCTFVLLARLILQVFRDESRSQNTRETVLVYQTYIETQLLFLQRY